MAALTTVADFIESSRRLLQDEMSGAYRYSDASLVEALNFAILEARRLRPDLFIGKFSSLPAYSAQSLGTAVDISPQYRSALLYYVCGHIQMSDAEDATDQRATVFLNKFAAQMQTMPS